MDLRVVTGHLGAPGCSGQAEGSHLHLQEETCGAGSSVAFQSPWEGVVFYLEAIGGQGVPCGAESCLAIGGGGVGEIMETGGLHIHLLV